MKEYRNLGFYLSDSIYGCLFFFLTGLHFFHVSVGLVLLGIFTSTPEAIGWPISKDLIFQGVYWHFVEVIWQFIFLILYCYLAPASKDFTYLQFPSGRLLAFFSFRR